MSAQKCTYGGCDNDATKDGFCGWHGGADCRCQAITKTGLRCVRAADNGKTLCHVHRTHGIPRGLAQSRARTPRQAVIEVESGEDKVVLGKPRQQLVINVHKFSGDVDLHAEDPKDLRVLVNGKVCRKFR